jgi:hypothetical protein
MHNYKCDYKSKKDTGKLILKFFLKILSFVDRAALYDLVNKFNSVHNPV